MLPSFRTNRENLSEPSTNLKPRNLFNSISSVNQTFRCSMACGGFSSPALPFSNACQQFANNHVRASSLQARTEKCRLQPPDQNSEKSVQSVLSVVRFAFGGGSLNFSAPKVAQSLFLSYSAAAGGGSFDGTAPVPVSGVHNEVIYMPVTHGKQ